MEYISSKEIQKMVFIYNAVNDGWSVKKIEKSKYEFTKELNNFKNKKEINFENYLKKFLLFNLSIENLPSKT
jgi:hypothetical protein